MHVTIYHSEQRPVRSNSVRTAGKTVRWTVLSCERRELKRAAPATSDMRGIPCT